MGGGKVGGVNLAVRLPNGDGFRGRFENTDTVGGVMHWIVSQSRGQRPPGTHVSFRYFSGQSASAAGTQRRIGTDMREFEDLLSQTIESVGIVTGTVLRVEFPEIDGAPME
eukprot:GDKI01038382.1.p1 GENE.GDKI01038382.1~~GDKI01038382.1.p1  ORF type:complete len:111 (-),score=33.30 GDKI01038382.1:37-369(-)